MAVTVVVILAAALAAVGFLLLLTTLVRRKPHSAGPSGSRVITTPEAPDAAPPAPPRVAALVPDSPEVQVNRRLFLNRAWLLAMTVFGVAFGGTSLGFFWPTVAGGFGGLIRVDRTPRDLREQIEAEGQPYYNPEGRFYIVTYDTSDPDNRYVEAGVAKEGLMVMYQKCAHLGCRVPFCVTSQWFECPCHGSMYNWAGEVLPGSPAAAGLWRFRLEIEEDGSIVIDTSDDTAQPPGGTYTIVQPPSGPHCIADAQ